MTDQHPMLFDSIYIILMQFHWQSNNGIENGIDNGIDNGYAMMIVLIGMIETIKAFQGNTQMGGILFARIFGTSRTVRGRTSRPGRNSPPSRVTASDSKRYTVHYQQP